MPTSFDEFVSRFPPHLKTRHFPKDAHDITPGKMKCEKEISEAVFLRLGLENYKRALNDIIQIQGKNIQILKTSPTTMETAEQTKVALTPYDDKRMWYRVSQSEPYGMEEDYDKELVLDRIVDNYLDCSLEDFKWQIEQEIPYHLEIGI